MSDLAKFAARLSEWIRRAPPGDRTPTGDAVPPGAEHEPQFNALALELFALQFDANGAYRKLCEARGVRPGRLTHWSEIPAVPTAAFKELEMTCLPPERRERVFESSGTTRRATSRHFHDATSLALYEMSAWRWFRAHVTPEFGHSPMRWRGLFLTPPPQEAPRSSLVSMFEVVRRELGLGAEVFVGRVSGDGAWELDGETALRVLREAGERGEPVLALGTAFSFVHLLDGLAAGGLRFALPRGSRVMETGGYKGRARELSRAELHAQVSERLGVPLENIVREYGMCELSSQAYDAVVCGEEAATRPQRQFRFPPWARARVVSPETGEEVAVGETGLLRVFDLANVCSVLAVQTEDLAVRGEEGFELAGRLANAEPRGCSLLAA
ncbi:MAG: hypothetical protein RMK20_09175 [Verrucomicrobiales bacterium]|nr:hypothetical protein [Verrucomicrobiales bacterium]